MSIAHFSAFVHAIAPHQKLEFFACYSVAAAVAVAAVYLRCCYTGSEGELQGSWLVKTAAAAAPIPVYVLLPLSPFDPDLAKALLEEQVILGLAGLYGIVETLRDVRGTAGEARSRAIAKSGAAGGASPPRKRWLVYVAVILLVALTLWMLLAS